MTAKTPKHAVIVGASGTGTSFGLISRLRAVWGDRIHLIAIDMLEPHLVTASVLADEFVRVPRVSAPEFDSVIAGILEKHPEAIVYPIVNGEFGAFQRLSRSGRFPKARFVLPDEKVIPLVSDKVASALWLADIGVRTPRTLSVAETLEATADDAQIFFAKPRDGAGSIGAGKTTRGDLARLPAEERAKLTVQELCTPPEVTVDAFCDSTSGFVAAVCRERLEVKTGVCTKARLFHDTELAAWAKAIGLAAGMRGSFCFQVMKAADAWVLTDLNFRHGAGTALSAAAGFDFLAAMHACRIGEDPRPYLDMASLVGRQIFVTRQYAEFVTRADA